MKTEKYILCSKNNAYPMKFSGNINPEISTKPHHLPQLLRAFLIPLFYLGVQR